MLPPGSSPQPYLRTHPRQPVDQCRGAGAHHCGQDHHHYHHCHALLEEQERPEARHHDEPASESKDTWWKL